MSMPFLSCRHHLELQWQRQQEQEQLLAAVPSALASGGVIEVQGLLHLERVLEAASGQLVALTVYSRCGGWVPHGVWCSCVHSDVASAACPVPQPPQRNPC